MTKKIVALLLAALMIVSMLPVAIMADGEDETVDPVETDSIERQPGVYFDNAEWVNLNGTSIIYVGNGGLTEEAYTTETNPVSMSVLFEVKGIRKPLKFGRLHWDTLGTDQTTAIDSNNSGNYLMSTSFEVKEDGMYAVQMGFNFLNWVGSSFGKVNRLALFKGTRGVEFSSDNSRAVVRAVGLAESNVSYKVTFCNTDGTEIMNAEGALNACGTYSSRIDAVPALADLYTSDVVPTKEETAEYKYEFAGWQTEKGVPVDYATFTGKVYPRFNEIDKTKATVTFIDGDEFELSSKTINIGEVATYDGETPTKSEDDDNTYVFSHWTVDGEKVDLATYKPDRNTTFAATFVPVAKTKATVYAIDLVSFGGKGKYGIQLNRTDITTDALKSETTPITKGKLKVSTSGLTNNGATEFEVSFDQIDEDGFTNVEFTLDETVGYAGKCSISVNGTVEGNSASVELYDNVSTVVIDGQQVGQYYVADDETAVQLPDNVSGLKETTIWEGNVDLDSAGGVTFVFRATGIEEAINATALRVYSTTNKNPNVSDMGSEWAYTNGWSGNVDENGTIDRALYMRMSESGYYYVYLSRKALGMSTRDCAPIATINKVSLFAPGGTEFKKLAEEAGSVASNTNENAKMQLVAIVKENLKPSVTFMNGNEVIATQEYAYTDFNNTETSLMGDKTGNIVNHFGKGMLITPEDLFAMTEAETPVKESDIEKVSYEFDGWVDADGKAIDGIYMSGNVYAHYKVTDNRTKYIIKFVNEDGSVLEQKICAEGETPEYTGALPRKAATNDHSYEFKGWDKEITSLPLTDKTDGQTDPTPIEYKATYNETVRKYDVYFYDEDKTTKLDEVIFIEKGGKAEPKVTPVKPATAQYTYTFDKWVDADGKDVDLNNITKDMNVYATYKSTVNKYTVTFLDDDEKELGKVTVDYGTEAKFDAPTKEKDEKYTYTFEKWDAGEGDLTKVVSDMTVKAVYSKEFTMFKDVVASKWYGDKIEYVVNHGYMGGMGDGTFAPEGTTTRAQLVQVFYNMELKPSVDGYENPFTDVDDDAWYANAIKWAYAKGIVSGMSETTFEPETPVTRAQACRIVYNYSDKIHHYSTEIPMTDPTTVGIFKDKNSIPTWAVSEIKWCMYVGCISGFTEAGGQYMKANDPMTRAQMATILMLWDQSDKLVTAQ